MAEFSHEGGHEINPVLVPELRQANNIVRTREALQRMAAPTPENCMVATPLIGGSPYQVADRTVSCAQRICERCQ